MKKLDPKSKWIFMFNGMSVCMVFITFLLPVILTRIMSYRSLMNYGNDLTTTTIILSIAPLFLLAVLIGWVYGSFAYKFYGYELNENGLRKERGIITKKYTTIPYIRIQNVDIVRGPLSRILGLSQLRVQTAGDPNARSAISEGLLPGLSKDVAELLRDELIKRSMRNKNESGL